MSRREEPILTVDDLRVHYPRRHAPSGWGGGSARWPLPGRPEARGPGADPDSSAASEWREIRAVDGISLELRPGETLALVGESGCGKSSTGKALLRLVEPRGGRILYRGQDVRAMDRTELRRFRRRVQMVFQDPFSSLNPRLRVKETLEEVLRVHRLGGNARGRRQRAGELLEQVGLAPDHLDRYPHQFSGGERQRVGIARALAVEPEILLLDEPVSALDVSVRAQVIGLLRKLQEELGLAYLFIAHDLAVVAEVSHWLAVMYLGRIVESGPARKVFGDPRHPYTRALISAIPRVHPGEGGRGGRILLTGDPAHPPKGGAGCPFHPRCWWPEKGSECLAECPALESWEGGEGHRAACIKIENPKGIST